MSITYIMGSKLVITDEKFEELSQIVNQKSNYTVCNNFIDVLRGLKYNENVLRIKNTELTNSEEDILTWFRGKKVLFLLSDPIMHDHLLLSFFNEVFLYDPKDNCFDLIKYSRAKL
jgi:hypothetical protein